MSNSSDSDSFEEGGSDVDHHKQNVSKENISRKAIQLYEEFCRLSDFEKERFLDFIQFQKLIPHTEGTQKRLDSANKVKAGGRVSQEIFCYFTELKDLRSKLNEKLVESNHRVADILEKVMEQVTKISTQLQWLKNAKEFLENDSKERQAKKQQHRIPESTPHLSSADSNDILSSRIILTPSPDPALNTPPDYEFEANILEVTNQLPNILEETNQPPNILGETNQPPNILGETNQPPNILGETNQPPNILGETNQPPSFSSTDRHNVPTTCKATSGTRGATGEKTPNPKSNVSKRQSVKHSRTPSIRSTKAKSRWGTSTSGQSRNYFQKSSLELNSTSSDEDSALLDFDLTTAFDDSKSTLSTKSSNSTLTGGNLRLCYQSLVERMTRPKITESKKIEDTQLSDNEFGISSTFQSGDENTAKLSTCQNESVAGVSTNIVPGVSNDGELQVNDMESSEK